MHLACLADSPAFFAKRPGAGSWGTGEYSTNANPKHAEFIVDSPLEWYADGPIDDVMAEWDDECALGLGGVGWGGDLGEGLGGEDGDWAEGADAALEDWADAVYEADMGCM